MHIHPIRFLRAACAAAFLTLAAAPQPLFAQDAAAPAAAPTKKGKDMNLLDYYFSGGFWMHPILLLSMGAVTLIILNFTALRRQTLLRPDLIPELSRKVAEGDIGGAKAICDANPCLFTDSLKGGLDRIVTDELDLDAVRDGIDSSVQVHVAARTKFINWISNIATVAPMLGLLGTVTGMIGAFTVLSAGGMASGAEEMASNISVAMVTTAGGLIVAIPASMFYFFFKSRFGELLSELGDELGKIMNALKTGVATGHLHMAANPGEAPAQG